ncbi:MAG: hypothetical protein SF053_00575 [Bacteroidia bacterium]|nr:hypothetical protein [Bacteroidia bacterium]
MKFLFFLWIFLLGTVSGYTQSIKEAIRLINDGRVSQEAQNSSKAEAAFKQALSIVEGQDEYWEGIANYELGKLYLSAGDEKYALGIQYLDRARVLFDGLKQSASIYLQSIDALVGSDKPRYGGIEIGTRGVKMVVVSTRINSTGDIKFTIEAESDSVTRPGDLTITSNKSTVAAVEMFYRQLRSEYHISADNIFAVISSGVDEMSNLKGELARQSLLQLKDQISQIVQRDVEIVKLCREGELVMIGTVRKGFRPVSSTIDVGSGTTKGVYQTPNGLLKCLELPYGPETILTRIENEVSGNFQSLDLAASQFCQTVIRDEIRSSFNLNPEFKNRKDVNLIGGIVWVFCTYMYPEKRGQDFVACYIDDVKRFKALALTNYEKLTDPDLSMIHDPAMLKLVKQDIERAKNNFKPEQIIAGANLLLTIMEEYERYSSPKRFQFLRDGYVGWITGYIVESK